MAIFLAGKAVCYRILAFFCYGKLHFKCESADLLTIRNKSQTSHISKQTRSYALCFAVSDDLQDCYDIVA